MNQEPYTVQAYKNSLGSLASPRNLYYTEVSYANATTTNLCVIDFKGDITELPPECNSAFTCTNQQECTIMMRYVVGPSIGANSAPVMMSGYIIHIPMDVLLNNYQVYIKELNVVICLRDRASLAKHPYCSVNYGTLLDKTAQAIIETREGMPTVQFVVNDPANQLRAECLYGVMYNEIYEIPVTHERDVDNKCRIYSNFTMGNKAFSYFEDLDPLIDPDPKKAVDVMELHNDLNLAIAVTRRAAEKFKREYKKITAEDLKQREQQITSAIEYKYQSKINGLEQERDSLKITLNRVESERDRYKDQYNTIIADHKTRADLDDINVRRQEADAKSRIADNNVAISDNNVSVSDNKVKESKVKMWHVIAAAAVPLVVGGAIKLIDAYIKMKTGGGAGGKGFYPPGMSSFH